MLSVIDPDMPYGNRPPLPYECISGLQRGIMQVSKLLANIMVRLSACVMWKTLAGGMQRSGLGAPPRSLFDHLAKIKSFDPALNSLRICKMSKTLSR